MTRPFLRPAWVLVLAALAIPLLTGCDAVGPTGPVAPPTPAGPGPLADVLAAEPGFETFARLAARVDLPARIAAYAAAGGGPVTVLAPDDEAFALMSPESVDRLAALNGGAALERVLLRHVVLGAVDPAALADGQTLETLEGTPLGVYVAENGAVRLGPVGTAGPAGTSGPVTDAALAGEVAGGATRVGGAVGETASGPVVRVSAVLRDHLTARERVAASPSLSRSLALFAAAGVDLTGAGPGTYLVPVDVGYDRFPGGHGAFLALDNAALVRKTVRALVVPGEGLTAEALADRATVTTAAGSALAVEAAGGLTLLGAGPGGGSPWEGTPGEARVLAADLPVRGGGRLHVVSGPLQGHLTLMERVDFLPQTETFAGLVRQAGLADRLAGPGPLTVFAPTEAAFDSLGARARPVLMAPAEAGLREVIARFHVVPQDAPSSTFENGASFPTLASQPLRVRPNPFQNLSTSLSLARPGAHLDLPASNGRLHLVSSLLNPDVTVFDQLFFSGAVTFREAARIAGYRPLLEGPAPVTVIAPRSVSDQFLQPAFACRARELAQDHITPGVNGYTPLAGPYELTHGHRINYRRVNPLTFVLERIDVSSIDVTYVPVGSTPVRYVNFETANGSLIHGVDTRLRWYAGGFSPTHAVNLPPCPG